MTSDLQSRTKGKPRDIFERLVRALRGSERKNLMRLLGITEQFTTPQDLREQIACMEFGRRNPDTFFAALRDIPRDV